MLFIILPIIILIILIIGIITIFKSNKISTTTTNAPQITTTTNAIIRTPILTAIPKRDALFTNSPSTTNIRKITSPKHNNDTYLLYLNNDYTLGVYGKFDGTDMIALPNKMWFKDIDAGFVFFMGITLDNKLYINNTFQPLTEITDIIKISAGNTHWLALDNNGTIYTNGFTHTKQQNELITIPDILKTTSKMDGIIVKSISASNNTSAAVGEDNNIYIWGYREGFANYNNFNIYTIITPTLALDRTISSIVVNSNNLIALDSDNKIILNNNNTIYGSTTNISLSLNDTIKSGPISYLIMNNIYAACIINKTLYTWGNSVPQGVQSSINNVIDVAISSNTVFTLSINL